MDRLPDAGWAGRCMVLQFRRTFCVLLLAAVAFSGSARGEIRSALEEASAIQQQFRSVIRSSVESVYAVTAFVEAPADAALWSSRLTGEQFAELAAQHERSCGSAFAVDDSGRLLTNEHVVSGATSVWVTDDAGRVWPALVIGTDPRSDLAVLQIPADTRGLPLAEQTPLRGDLVVTLGNPDGTSTAGAMSASIGNVSVPDRSLPKLSERERRHYGRLIQMTTPIAVGSSGGPLLDLEGRVLGMVCAVATPAAQTGVPIGFAMNLSPADARERISRLIQGEEIVYGYLGVMVSPVWDVATREGVRVDRVDAQTPADGILRAGDIVLRFDGTPVNSDKAFIELAGTGPVDRDVLLRVRRGDDELDLTVRPRRRVLGSEAITLATQRIEWAGVRFKNHEAAGVEVEAVGPHAEDAPEIGTIIRSVNGDGVHDLAGLLRALHRHIGQTLTLSDEPPPTAGD